MGVSPEHTPGREGSDSSPRSAARPGPASACPLSFRPCPGSIPPVVLDSSPAGRYPRAAPLSRPSAGTQRPGTGARRPRGSVRSPLPARPRAASRRHARPSSPSAPVTSACAAARTAPDPPAQRGRGQVSGRQVSPSKTGFLGERRHPTFLRGVGLPLQLPLPLPPLSVLLAAALAPLLGLRHSARALGRWDRREVQKAGGWNRLCSLPPSCAPRCLQPQCPSAEPVL